MYNNSKTTVAGIPIMFMTTTAPNIKASILTISFVFSLMILALFQAIYLVTPQVYHIITNHAIY